MLGKEKFQASVDRNFEGDIYGFDAKSCTENSKFEDAPSWLMVLLLAHKIWNPCLISKIFNTRQNLTSKSNAFRPVVFITLRTFRQNGRKSKLGQNVSRVKWANTRHETLCVMANFEDRYQRGDEALQNWRLITKTISTRRRFFKTWSSGSVRLLAPHVDVAVTVMERCLKRFFA